MTSTWLEFKTEVITQYQEQKKMADTAHHMAILICWRRPSRWPDSH